MASQQTVGISGEVDSGNMHTADEDNIETPQSDDHGDSATRPFDFSGKTWREDMTLLVEGRKLYVASNILSLLSPVFTAMFEEQFREEGPREVELKDKKGDDVAEFLRCLYPNILKKVTEENVFAVIPLADEFEVKHLKKACEDFLVKAITSAASPDKVCKYLQLAFRHKMDALRGECVAIASGIRQTMFADAEKKYPLPAELKVEVQESQIKQFGDILSQLKIKQRENTKLCENLEECVKYFWVERGNIKDFSDSKFGILNLEITNASSFIQKNSSKILIHGIKWYLSAEKRKHTDGKDYFAVHLECDAPKAWQKWSCQVITKVLLVRKDTGTHYQAGEHLIKTFSSISTSNGYPTFIAMIELLSGEKYVKNDCAELKAYFLVREPVCKPETEKYQDSETDM